MEAFEKRQKAGIRYDLDRMRKVLELLGNPQNTGKAVHIAGTNGKGSTAAYMEALLKETCTTWTFISPSFSGREEQFRWCGRAPDEETFARWVDEVLPAVEETEKQFGMMTPFELTTTVFYYAAREKQPDVLIVEAGMGGKLDATNVIEHPSAAVITSIGSDHLTYLGGSRETAARHKAGIFREGVPAICSADQEALVWLKEEAESAGAVWTPPVSWEWEAPDRLTIDGESVTLPASGRHQASNAALAYTACIHTGSIAAPKHLSKAVLPGRSEEVLPGVTLDTAHNPEAVNAVTSALPQHPDRLILFACMKDKDAAGMIAMLESCGKLTAASWPSPRAQTCSEWKDMFPDLPCTDDPVQWVKTYAGKRPLLILGSHDFASFLRPKLIEMRNNGAGKE
ncbi:bifunctional folylpolyglutamate synthase/dihydrofolate synthase [Alkalicoccus urumqiensis]|nr:Mur ligase family protein [Alkalicoccus urumqiensis]